MTDLTHTILELDNLNLILDNLKLGIIVHTPERIIKVFNKEAERITGYFRDEVLDKDCHMVFQEPFCGGKCSFCDNTSPQLPFGSKEYPLSIITKDGATKHLEMTVSAIFDRGSEFKGVLASFRDITESFNLSLKAEKLSSFAGMIGKAKVMQQIFTQIRDVALYNYPVHISGETGTGKERAAWAIHEISSYGTGPFVPVNCGALPEGIVESELFGHVKGAFSGAVKERKGRFELAHKGTLFLDEVADLPLNTQVKLLRFLQEGSFEKVGGEKKVNVDVRIISAANKNLREEVAAGRFREDLFYRLNVIPIHIPPLRERINDIPLLAAHFLKEAEQENKNKVPELSHQALDLMMDYEWPGNVRQLKNVIQFAVVRAKTGRILASDLPAEISAKQDFITSMAGGMPEVRPVPVRTKLNIESVKQAIKKTGGNKSKAARLLGVGRATLYRFLSQNSEIKDFINQF